MEKSFEVVKHKTRGRDEVSKNQALKLQLDNQYAVLGDQQSCIHITIKECFFGNPSTKVTKLQLTAMMNMCHLISAGSTAASAAYFDVSDWFSCTMEA